MSTTTSATPQHDGAGFAWYAGIWAVANRRRNADGIWEEFAATCRVSMCVDDLVQLDHYDAPEFPGRGHVKAVTVRAYDAPADTWSIIWLCNYAEPDFLPMVGRWDGDEGLFLQTIADADGSPLDVRFRWSRDGSDRARWEQAFSSDGRATWDANWTMAMTRRR
jgi:hypothetical protein